VAWLAGVASIADLVIPAEPSRRRVLSNSEYPAKYGVETLGAPPGAHQDPNSSTRSIGEPGMPEMSCIASEVDDLRPLRMGPISGVMLL